MMELVQLGAAGCLYGNGDRCAGLRSDLAGYTCDQYRMPLADHCKGGQPIRANLCAEEAEKVAWLRILRTRT